MVVLECLDAQMKSFFGTYLIKPYLLQEALASSQDVAVRNAMRGIEAGHINPALIPNPKRF
jgi:hypothetical protein